MTRLVALLGRAEVRFLAVGGVNTAVGLGSFVVLYALAGAVLHYLGALALAYAIGTLVGFVLHRRLVFDVQGHLVADFARYVGVQAVAFTLNSLLLPVLVEAAGLPVVLGQVLALGIVVVASYFGHKLISFRRPPQPAGPGDVVPPPPPRSRREGLLDPAAGRRSSPGR